MRSGTEMVIRDGAAGPIISSTFMMNVDPDRIRRHLTEQQTRGNISSSIQIWDRDRETEMSVRFREMTVRPPVRVDDVIILGVNELSRIPGDAPSTSGPLSSGGHFPSETNEYVGASSLLRVAIRQPDNTYRIGVVRLRRTANEAGNSFSFDRIEVMGEHSTASMVIPNSSADSYFASPRIEVPTSAINNGLLDLNNSVVSQGLRNSIARGLQAGALTGNSGVEGALGGFRAARPGEVPGVSVPAPAPVRAAAPFTATLSEQERGNLLVANATAVTSADNYDQPPGIRIDGLRIQGHQVRYNESRDLRHENIPLPAGYTPQGDFLQVRDAHNNGQQYFIEGQWQRASDGGTRPVFVATHVVRAAESGVTRRALPQEVMVNTGNGNSA
jgi:hypothetical protein